MILSEGNDLSNEEFVLDFTHMKDQPVLLEQSKLMLYHTLKKVRDGVVDLEYEQAKKYIELRYVQRIIDYDNQLDQEIPFMLKICEHNDYLWN